MRRDEREQLTLAEAQFHATWQGHIVTLINERDAVLSWEQIKRSAKF